jgi:hypothetical protein
MIVEDGTGRPNADSYASVAASDTYHDGHLYAADWTGASTGTKEKALIMATRLIDALYQFRGYRANNSQALQWPRSFARDNDKLGSFVPLQLASRDEYFASDALPKTLVDATIETARELIKANRTDDPDGEGIRRMTLTGALTVTFDPQDRAPVIPHVAQAMLSKLGSFMAAKSGTARLVRT